MSFVTENILEAINKAEENGASLLEIADYLNKNSKRPDQSEHAKITISPMPKQILVQQLAQLEKENKIKKIENSSEERWIVPSK